MITAEYEVSSNDSDGQIWVPTKSRLLGIFGYMGMEDDADVISKVKDAKFETFTDDGSSRCFYTR